MSTRGGEGVKIGQNLVHVVVEYPLVAYHSSLTLCINTQFFKKANSTFVTVGILAVAVFQLHYIGMRYEFSDWHVKYLVTQSGKAENW